MNVTFHTALSKISDEVSTEGTVKLSFEIDKRELMRVVAEALTKGEIMRYLDGMDAFDILDASSKQFELVSAEDFRTL